MLIIKNVGNNILKSTHVLLKQQQQQNYRESIFILYMVYLAS